MLLNIRATPATLPEARTAISLSGLLDKTGSDAELVEMDHPAAGSGASFCCHSGKPSKLIRNPGDRTLPYCLKRSQILGTSKS